MPPLSVCTVTAKDLNARHDLDTASPDECTYDHSPSFREVPC
jgi:hypothetical protein